MAEEHLGCPSRMVKMGLFCSLVASAPGRIAADCGNWLVIGRLLTGEQILLSVNGGLDIVLFISSNGMGWEGTC